MEPFLSACDVVVRCTTLAFFQQDGTLIGTSFLVSFGYWMGSSFAISSMSFVCNTHLSLMQILSINVDQVARFATWWISVRIDTLGLCSVQSLCCTLSRDVHPYRSRSSAVLRLVVGVGWLSCCPNGTRERKFFVWKYKILIFARCPSLWRIRIIHVIASYWDALLLQFTCSSCSTCILHIMNWRKVGFHGSMNAKFLTSSCFQRWRTRWTMKRQLWASRSCKRSYLWRLRQRISYQQPRVKFFSCLSSKWPHSKCCF